MTKTEDVDLNVFDTESYSNSSYSRKHDHSRDDDRRSSHAQKRQRIEIRFDMPVSSFERERDAKRWPRQVDEEIEMRKANAILDPHDPEYQNPLLLQGSDQINPKDVVKHQ